MNERMKFKIQNSKFKIEQADVPDCNLLPKTGFARWVCRVLMVVLMVAFAVPSQAQSHSYRHAMWQQPKPKTSVEMGLALAGAYMFTVPESELVSLKPRIGVRGALSMSICWHDSYALQLELAYLYNKVEAQTELFSDKRSYDVKVGAMEIPVMFSFRGINPMRLNLGVVFSAAATGRYDLEMERVEFGGLRPLAGYVVGVGVNLTPNLMLEARYTGGFSRTMNYFEGVEFYTNTQWLTLGVGYMF